mmetsp:Transcript_32264/g.97124  ORF Transcript_32264/g.97124 Transcript_32264/m.97124 type:complete len:170 (-) Transcript_32264:567-1076(-)
MTTQLLPNQHGRRRRFYTPEEVSAHNSADDAWFCVFGKALDLTVLIASKTSALTQPLINCAGNDVSHWFHSKSENVKTYYSQDKKTNLPYMPMGRFLHVPPCEPTSKWCTAMDASDDTPWWQDVKYTVGSVSQNVRQLRVVNVLTQQSDVLEVCGEETMEEIQSRRYPV